MKYELGILDSYLIEAAGTPTENEPMLKVAMILMLKVTMILMLKVTTILMLKMTMISTLKGMMISIEKNISRMIWTNAATVASVEIAPPQIT